MTDWIEPTPPVRWGSPRWRYGVGLVVIVLGAAATTLTSTYSLWFLGIGPLVQLLGWLILPGALWRRLLVLLPCLVAALVLVAGPDFVGAFAVLLAGWLFARHRPPLSYLAVLPMIVLSFVLKSTLNEYGQNWIGLLSGSAATVAGAWLGRALAVWRWRRLEGRVAGRMSGPGRVREADPVPEAGRVREADPVPEAGRVREADPVREAGRAAHGGAIAPAEPASAEAPSTPAVPAYGPEVGVAAGPTTSARGLSPDPE